MLGYLASEFALPLINPVLRFLLILVIILIVPILLNKIRIPQLLGLIIAGAVVGTNGLNLLERDSSIILSGTAGLLYIMFLAGLEIDLADFKKNSKKSIVFGLYTFCIPMVMGIVVGLYVLEFSMATSVLLASMFASHTLIAYPMISKFGVAKNIAVNITVGGTLITDTLALLVLAVVVGVSQGDVNTAFWIRLSISIVLFGLVVLLVFPIIGRWFFKRFDDNVSQYIFVLVMVFSGAVLAELAGIEAIIGAFLAGLSLNRLIPHTSPLMNRIEFVGNAIFIPFFLIGVGMLIDYRAFFKDFETIKVAGIMIVVATTAKFLAAYLTQKTFNFTIDQRRLIFGLSNAQAAATLAAVLVGYNIILDTSDAGEPIRLLNENVLNGTILMILFTCTVASFVAQKGARNIALTKSTDEETQAEEKILIPLSYPENIDELINLGITVKSKKNKHGLYALSIVDNTAADGTADKNARKSLHQATVTAAATDNSLKEIIRYDLNIVSGITSVIREQKITDLILGLHVKTRLSDSFLGKLTEGILTRSSTTTLIYKPNQPFATLRKHLIVVPEMAEKEIGFSLWLQKIWNMARNSGAQIRFFASAASINAIKAVQAKQSLNCTYTEFTNWNDFLTLSQQLGKNDNLIIVMSRKDQLSYHSSMASIPDYLNMHFEDHSFILIYPMQSGLHNPSKVDFTSPTLIEPIEKLSQIGRLVQRIFRSKPD